jgi:hypothetical protein
MPTPESESSPPPPSPYREVRRFTDENTSEKAYIAAQNAIFRFPGNDLSVYRLAYDSAWFLAVLGQLPPRVLDRQLRRILAAGAPGALPAEVVAHLEQRRLEAIKLGSWVERHARKL